VKYKQVEFMMDHIGQVYEGVISGITEWGLYVELNENKCEGMIPMRDLGDDYFEFDERNYCLIGRRSHQRYNLGDALKVQVARANLERKQLDFSLAEKPVAAGSVSKREARAEVSFSKKGAKGAKGAKKRR
jgi:ribonuclease R